MIEPSGATEDAAADMADAVGQEGGPRGARA